MIEFYWSVPTHGFTWLAMTAYPDGNLQRKGILGTYLTLAAPPGDPETYKNYAVFKETGLFRTFASLSLNEESILDFANRYGWLGGGAAVPARRPLERKSSYQLVAAEPRIRWASEIGALRHLLALEDKSRSGDQSVLSEFISWVSGPAGSLREREVHYRGPRIPGEKWPKALVIPSQVGTGPAFQDGDLIEPAKEIVRLLINQKVKEHSAFPQLLWERNRNASARRIRTVPDSLIAALWVQFAMAVDGNREYRQCDECRKWFEIAAEKREDARFCSNACRFKAYRKRQKEAKRLHADGASMRAIAKTLCSDVETVKGWIEK